MKKNFRNISLVAGFVTLVCFGANAQLTGPVNNTLTTTNNVRLTFTPEGAGFELSEAPDKAIRLNLFNAFGAGTGYGTSGIGFNLKRIPTGFNGQWTGIWNTNSDNFNNGGASIFGDVWGNVHFLTIPSNPNGKSAGNVIGQSFSTDALAMSYKRMLLTSNGQLRLSSSTGSFGNDVTNDQSVRLTVNGKILAEGVKVALNGSWPDFVFAKQYKLAPLSEVETFIAVNSHLPNVPSEAEVKGNGIDMAEMDAVLLRKIEELTLYMIQLKKENEELSKKVEALSDKQ